MIPVTTLIQVNITYPLVSMSNIFSALEHIYWSVIEI